MRLAIVPMSAATLMVLAGCSREREPAAGDTAAVRMEQEGAVPEKTLPDGVVDTAVVGVPAGGPVPAPDPQMRQPQPSPEEKDRSSERSRGGATDTAVVGVPAGGPVPLPDTLARPPRP